MVSCVYARPFDRMPVEVTHLHSSLEGVTPTEVVTGFYLLLCRAEVQALQLLSCICTSRYTRWRPNLPDSLSTTVFIGQWMVEGSLDPCYFKWKEKRRNMRGLFVIRGIHTHTRTHTHTQKKKKNKTRTHTHTHYCIAPWRE